MKSKKITLNSMRKYRLYLNQEEKSKATIEKYMREVYLLFEFLEGMEISKQKIIEYRKNIISVFSPKTVNTKLSAINSYLEFEGQTECMVKLLKIQRQAFADEEKELSEQEYKRLLAVAQKKRNTRLYHLMLTICCTGIRVSELQFITVEALQTGKVKIHLKGKDRIILLPKKLRSKLEKYIKSRCIKKGPVFQTRNGKPMDRSNICHEMKQLCEEASVDRKKVFPHNFRHLFARSFYAVEKNLAMLADILGHSSIETTRIYVAVGSKTHEKIMKKMKLIQ